MIYKITIQRESGVEITRRYDEAFFTWDREFIGKTILDMFNQLNDTSEIK